MIKSKRNIILLSILCSSILSCNSFAKTKLLDTHNFWKAYVSEVNNNKTCFMASEKNSNSVWKSHALYLIAEYFFHKNQKQKAKEFYIQILNNKKSNENIIKKTQKRLNSDFSE